MAGGSKLAARVIGGRLMFAPLAKADPASSGPPTPAAPAAVDAAGKPIEAGAVVALPTGGSATVVSDDGGGQITVTSDADGSEFSVAAADVTVIRTAEQNAGTGGPDALQAALDANPDATPPPGDQPAAQAEDQSATGDVPVGASPAPDADPAGAVAYLATDDGTQSAWLRTDEGDTPVGYLRTDTNDPSTTVRFTDTQAWAEQADAAGMAETDQVPPSPTTDSSSTPSAPSAAGNPSAGVGTNSAPGVDSSTAGDPAAPAAAGAPAQPDQEPAAPEHLPAAATAPTRLELDAAVAAPDQVFAFLSTGLGPLTGAGAADSIRSAKAQILDNLAGRMTQVPDEAILTEDDQERLARIDGGEVTLLRVPAGDQHFADPANPTVGEQLTQWTFREVPTGQFREVLASGQAPPEGLEVVTADQWRAWRRAARVAGAISRWAMTANGSDPEALALQETAADLFGMDDIAEWAGYADNPELREEVEQAKEQHGEFHRALLLAMYQATQEAFRTAQITAVRLFRGWRSYDGTPEWAVTDSTEELPLRPLSSATADERTAAGYARATDADSGWITTSSVPVERILATPRTGFGSLAVSELVILAGPGPWAVREATESDGSARGGTWDPEAAPVDPVEDDADPFDPVHTAAALIGSREQLTAAITAAPDDARRQALIARARTMRLSTLIPDSWAGNGAINPVDDSDQRGPDGQLVPLDPQELSVRVDAVTSAISQAQAAGLTSDKTFTVHGDGQVWTPERSKEHLAIVDAVWATATNVPAEGHALILAGLDPAGTAAALAQPQAGIDQADYLTINVADIKAIMAARDLIPDIPDAGVPLSPLERAPLVHEEAAHIANLIGERAAAERKNVAWDLTLADGGSLGPRITELRERYAEIKGVYVDAPLDIVAAHATAAYTAGVEAYRNGTGQGGRYVPPGLLTDLTGPEFGTKPRAAFEDVRDQFDDWQVWDAAADGRDPRLVYYKGAPELERLTDGARTGKMAPQTKQLLPGTRLVAVLAAARPTGGTR